MALYNFEIGLTLGTMVNVEVLATKLPAPKPAFAPFSAYVTLGNGLVRGIGFPTAEWRWGFLKWNAIGTTYRDILRNYIPTASKEVYIRTTTNENNDEYQIFKAIGVWPANEVSDTGRRLDFAITFKYLRVVG